MSAKIGKFGKKASAAVVSVVVITLFGAGIASAVLGNFAIVNGNAVVKKLFVTNATLINLTNGCSQQYDFPFTILNLTQTKKYTITLGCNHPNPAVGWKYEVKIGEQFPNMTKPFCSGGGCPNYLLDDTNVPLNQNRTSGNITVYYQFPTNGTIQLKTKAAAGGTCNYTCFAILNKVS